jgi:F0F1-type ATP synthase assembly protein I
MADRRDESPMGRGYGTGWAIVGAGFQLAFSILFFMGMGYLADGWLGTRPWLMLVGLAIGMAAGFYAFWMRVKAASQGPGR